MNFERMNELIDLRDDLRQILGSKHHPDRALRRLGRESLRTAADRPHRREAMAELQRRYQFDRARTTITEAIARLTDAIGDGTAPSTPAKKKKASPAKECARNDAIGGHDQ